jgi:hypothetical protein
LREAILGANEDRVVDGCDRGNGADTVILGDEGRQDWKSAPMTKTAAAWLLTRRRREAADAA